MRKPTRNRKKIIKDGWIEYKGESIEICNSQQYGIYEEMLHKFIEQLDIAYLIHKRLLVVRLDYRINYYTENNRLLSNHMKNIIQWLRREYGIKNVGYIWVREQEKSKKQHYHLVLILDGNKIQNPRKINAILKRKWTPRGDVFVPENCYYYIDKHNYKKQRQNVIYRCSYLAKSKGKGFRPPQTKDYACSRLKHF